MIRNNVRMVAAALLGTQLACLGPTRQYNPRTDFPEKQPSHIVVTFNDGRKTEISSPRLLGDTALAAWDPREQKAVEFPLSSIKSVTGRERSAARSSLLGLGIVTVIIVGGVALSAATSGEDDSTPF